MSQVREARPLLVDVAGRATTVRVTVEVRDERHVGEARSGAQPAEQVAAGARATLEALAEVTPGAVALDLAWCDVVRPPDDLPPLALVLVDVTVAGVPLRCPGTALLRERPVWAGARAVLQGLNRRLQVLGL